MVRPSNGLYYDSFIWGQYFNTVIDGAVAADDIKAIVRAEKLARHRQPDAEKKYFGIE